MEKFLPLTHRIVVSLFLLIYLVKTILLLMNKSEGLKSFSRLIKVPEMIVSALFLLTGIWLTINLFPKPGINMLYVIKITLVLASIPLAVIGFKKGNKMLAILSLLCIILGYGLAEMSKKKREKGEIATTAADGKEMFEATCISCHGENGKLMMSGASDLSVSGINRDSVISVITNGRNTMLPYQSAYSAEQIEKLADYVITLRGK